MPASVVINKELTSTACSTSRFYRYAAAYCGRHQYAHLEDGIVEGSIPRPSHSARHTTGAASFTELA